MSYSKITKKGQMTIPARYREKYNLKKGIRVAFEETDKGLLIKPIPDIADSAGVLSDFAAPEEVLIELMKTRKENFR
ncbi:MAG: AbrB/MazE/SpoVT family DNA-binding domain-containing protein [Methanocellales archaeon]